MSLTPNQVAALRKEAVHLLANLDGVKEYALIGSAMYLPDPADVDFAVLIETDPIDFTCDMENDGWGLCSDYDTSNDSVWAAIRKDGLNLMVTKSEDFYNKYLTAMEVCKALHLTDKLQRTAVCAIVRDGKKAWETDFYQQRHTFDEDEAL